MSDVKSYYLREDCPGGAWMAENTFDERREELYVRKEDYDRLRAERDGLRAALDKYGRHTQDCDKRYYGSIRPDHKNVPCSCGYDAALASTPSPGEG